MGESPLERAEFWRGDSCGGGSASAVLYPVMGPAPARSNDFFASRGENLEAQLRDLEHCLEKIRADEQDKIARLEETLLNESAHRIHDFERRLEHEWLALRQLHEESLKTVEQRTVDIAGNCVGVVHEALAVLRARESDAPPVTPAPDASPSRVTTIMLVAALLTLTALSAYTTWRLNRDLDAISARAAAGEARVAELQRFVENQSRDASLATQRLTSEALAAATKAQRLAGVLAASDVRVYPLRGQAAAAASGGQVFFSPARGIALSASRVSRLPSNQTYQLWATTNRGSVSLGFIEPDAQGRVDSAFEPTPDLAATIIGFMLTIEPTGGSEQPSGPIALTS